MMAFLQKTLRRVNGSLFSIAYSSKARFAMRRKCLGESEGLTFWLAQPEDYDNVMSISADIYGGDDYLPHRYHDWLKEPGRTVILARRESKLVALQSCLIVDEGATAVVQGLRLCPHERGRGLAWDIQRFIGSYIQQLHPTVKVKRATANVDPGLPRTTILARRSILSLVGEAESFDGFISHLKNKLQSSGVTSGLIPLNEAQVKRVLLDPKLPSRVQLPSGTIIQDCQPLRPVEGNLEILKRRNLTWWADSEEAPVFLSSYTAPYPIPYNGGSLFLNIDMFGTDHMLAQCALVSLFEAAWAKGELKGSVKVHVHMSPSLWETVQAFCEGHQGVTRGDFLEQFLLEREM